MTEEDVRAMFLKNYSGRSLNEALRETSEEIALAILAKVVEPDALPDIVKKIIGGRSRVGLFMAMFLKGTVNFVAPPTYIFHFDHIHKAMLDTINYMRDNYEAAHQFFKEQLTKEDLKMMSGDISEAIEKPTGLPANVRGVNFAELKKEDEFFSFALVGILGVERFQKYAEEYNKCVAVLRRCQEECKALRDRVDAKES